MDNLNVDTNLKEQDFLLAVEDAFEIKGSDDIITGRIERGTITIGDDIEISGMGKQKRVARVRDIEMFRKTQSTANAGDNVGIALDGVKKEDIVRGMILAKPGSLSTHSRFEAEVYVFSKDEGGRHTPFFNKYRPQFYLRTTDVTGQIMLKNKELAMPGDHVVIEVKLINEVAIEQGQRFAVREGGRSVGSGIITRIIE